MAILRLQATKNIGDVLAKKLIHALGDVEAIFDEKLKNLEKIPDIGKQSLKYLLDTKNLKRAEKELRYIEKEKLNYWYFLGDDYPANLRHCMDAPILFFSEGNIDFNNDKILSIVGTRNMSNYGRDICNQLISDLQKHNPIIVSGFAYGVDICAHKAAIENNLQTIAVLAHGFEEIYPKAHKKHMVDVRKNGGFISEFWHNEPPMRENFLKRNRIVAGLSQATIIIESGTKGGSLVTADIANSYNREVFAIPGRTTDLFSMGCNNLIKNHQAQTLTHADDLIKFLNWDIAKPQKVVQPQLFLDLNENEQKIYDFLLKNGKQLLDTIAFECSIPIYQLSSILLTMELKGIVKPLPGKYFEV